MLPEPLHQHLTALFNSEPRAVRSIGASMSAAERFEISGRAYVVKWLPEGASAPDGWPDMMSAEARGLLLLAQAEAVRIPAVIAYGPQQERRPPFLVMEWLDQAPAADRAAAGALLGRQLAEQHRFRGQFYGLEYHNYCGATPQQNTPSDSWIAFYGEQRLGFQLELAARHGRMPGSRRRRLEQLIERLDRWLPEPRHPALLHGDLWGGNWLVAADNRPAILDPAVYFGDREAELAMCRLFGGFPDSFYAAYDEAWPPEPGSEERVPLYQLYHLLNHLNLFGESYGAQVDAVLRRFVG